MKLIYTRTLLYTDENAELRKMQYVLYDSIDSMRYFSRVNMKSLEIFLIFLLF